MREFGPTSATTTTITRSPTPHASDASVEFNIPAGATSEYKNVKTILSYAAMKMTIDGTYVTGQTLNMGSKSFTYDIDIIDLEKGWLKIDIIRD